jgi:hypothetical protein
VVTGASLVEADFSGCLIQNVYDVGADSYCTYTSIPYKTGGLHLFGWIGKSEGPEYLVHSVSRIQKSDLANALIRYAFEFLENTFFSMSWWEGLDSEARSSLRRRCLSGATHQRSEDCLIDDGRFYDSWRLDQVYTNVPGLAAGRR